MSRVESTFKRLKNKGQAALVPFFVAGDPDLESTEALVLKAAEAGADIIELGIPFSDPLADGPTIQAASQRALQNGVALKDVLGLARRLQGKTPPLFLMTYFNPVFKYGLPSFAAECQKAAIAGVIIPDLPPEEAGPWKKEAQKVGLDTVFLAASTSSLQQLKKISRQSSGFIYYVSVTGVTGSRENLSPELEMSVRQLKGLTRKPVAVGFGISTPQQAKDIRHFADGVIVGSAIVKIVEEESKNDSLMERVGTFISSLARAVH